MFTYLLDKTEHLSLPVCYKTLNIWAGVTMTGNSSWGHFSHLEWWKPLKPSSFGNFLEDFTCDTHNLSEPCRRRWNGRFSSFKCGEWRWFTQKHLQGLFTDSFFHPLLSEDICADFSNFFLLPVTPIDWLHQLHSVQLLCGTIKAVSHRHRKCGSFYR